MRFVRENEIKVSRPGPDRFTDGVWEAPALEAVQPDGLRAQRFSYDPEARSGWHTHDGEQALYVLSGRGVITRWGESRGTEVGPGDWIHVQPGEKHWHGAVADDTLVHIAVTASGKTHWHGPVSDEEYRSSLE
ncbi:cupin domain-containing protein [Planotetraspora sp. A-T 1434]|uniref:cupin domain-containing protein n=1 Tax=Planotetraspora sp. A-T 1434 TaxID=2979219 RepID=UPI0021BEEA7F|nr:cupin domain-containing protein [Planotetraspora sp. A-T 1434]MCT9931202.1 cupin domain-containing protein [Planotetraspora sp. A-T 1434]